MAEHREYGQAAEYKTGESRSTLKHSGIVSNPRPSPRQQDAPHNRKSMEIAMNVIKLKDKNRWYNESKTILVRISKEDTPPNLFLAMHR